MHKPTYIDLFAGCGGLSLGLFNSGWEGLFAIEKSSDAFETLNYNLIDQADHFKWPSWLEKKNHDINYVIQKNKAELLSLRGKVDMVTGGPPCQGFSFAGLRKEDDDRNTLIKSYLRFITYVRPKVIFFENVKGFTLQFKKNRTKGHAYSSYVTEVLKRLGYNVEGQLVDFSAYGIPQKRTRFILVGVSKEYHQQKSATVNSFFETLEKNKEKFLIQKGISINNSLGEAISDLLKSNGTVSSIDSKGFESGLYGRRENKYQKLLRGVNSTGVPDSHRFANHTELVRKKFQKLIDSDGDFSAVENEFKTKKHSQQVLQSDEKSPTLTTLPDDYIHYQEPRILTVREYARIQSFPDWYKFLGKYTTGGKNRIKEVPRYSQIGNAIPPLFAEQAGTVLRKLISYARAA